MATILMLGPYVCRERRRSAIVDILHVRRRFFRAARISTSFGHSFWQKLCSRPSKRVRSSGTAWKPSQDTSFSGRSQHAGTVRDFRALPVICASDQQNSQGHALPRSRVGFPTSCLPDKFQSRMPDFASKSAIDVAARPLSWSALQGLKAVRTFCTLQTSSQVQHSCVSTSYFAHTGLNFSVPHHCHRRLISKLASVLS